MQRVGTIDPAAARVTPAHRVEMDERIARGRQATAARGAGDRAELPVTNGDRAKLGVR